MKHFLGSVGVRGSVRGPFFTRHPVRTVHLIRRSPDLACTPDTDTSDRARHAIILL